MKLGFEAARDADQAQLERALANVAAGASNRLIATALVALALGKAVKQRPLHYRPVAHHPPVSRFGRIIESERYDNFNGKFFNNIDPLRTFSICQYAYDMNPHRHIGRTSSIDAIAHRIVALRQSNPIRVAVDGRTASGKTTFADELAATIMRMGPHVVRASIDGFHRPKAVRHQRGRLSPDGYYEDARDLDAVRKLLLDPLGPSGDRFYVTAIFDLDRDELWKPASQLANEDTVLIIDGTFLQRPELRSAWDLVIFLDVPEDVARRRGVKRDSLALGGETSTSELYLRRYGPAFTRYETECRPAQQADVLIDNSTPI